MDSSEPPKNFNKLDPSLNDMVDFLHILELV